MPGPLPLVLGGAAILGFLLLRKSNSAPTPALQASVSAFNDAADKVAAANAEAIKAGITPLGHGPRQVDGSDVLQGPPAGNPPSNLVFSKHSPAAFHQHTPDDIAVSAQFGPGDIMTVDVAEAGMNIGPIPEGNILMQVTGQADMNAKTIPGVSIDPRFPNSTPVPIPLASITDLWSGQADLKGHIIGMGQ